MNVKSKKLFRITKKKNIFVLNQINPSTGYALLWTKVSFKSNDKEKWLLDSGASTHACNTDEREIAVTGRVTVKLRLQANDKTNILTLENVALVPDLGINLVSTGRLESQGLKIITEHGTSQIKLKNDLIGYATRNESNPYLYEFKLSSKNTVFVTK